MTEAMRRLSVSRPVFHSEADLQLALAWQIQVDHPEATIRLETRPIDDLPMYLDLAITVRGIRIAVELKYPTRMLSTTVGGERFHLRNHGAPDVGRYDIVKDVCRVERFLSASAADVGCVIVLTNEPSYWTPGRGGAADDAFRLHEGRSLSGELAWAARAGSGTTSTREQPLRVAGRYSMTWSGYSDLETRAGQFRQLIIPINSPASVPPDG